MFFCYPCRHEVRPSSEQPVHTSRFKNTDVVPVEDQPWVSDPFQVREQGGRLYGRGTSDMKSFLAIALALVPHALAAGLKVPLHLALSYDEEVGCLAMPTTPGVKPNAAPAMSNTMEAMQRDTVASRFVKRAILPGRTNSATLRTVGEAKGNPRPRSPETIP